MNAFKNLLTLPALAVLLLGGMAAHSARAADPCEIVRYSKRGLVVNMVSHRTTLLRFTVPNRGTANPERKRVRAGQAFSVTVSKYPLVITDLEAPGRVCVNQVIP